MDSGRATETITGAEKPRKVKKERKKKEKKMKVPSSALKKIPLFNFVRYVQPVQDTSE